MYIHACREYARKRVHNVQVRKLFSFCRGHQLLCHRCTLEMVTDWRRTTKKIHKLQDPTTQTELQSFLDFRNIFGHLIPNFFRIAVSTVVELWKEQSMTLETSTEEETHWIDKEAHGTCRSIHRLFQLFTRTLRSYNRETNTEVLCSRCSQKNLS